MAFEVCMPQLGLTMEEGTVSQWIKHEGDAVKTGDVLLEITTDKLTPDEYKGSTFSVSNLGMFGIETFTPIVNQPDAAILGVCAVEDELVMDDEGNISKHQVMRLSFTYDHRLIDGAVAAKFVMALRDLLEKPMSIIL